MIQLHLLNVDKYVNWYYNLCLSIHQLPENKNRRNRYLLAAYGLHARHILNPRNTRSQLLSGEFSDTAEVLTKQIDAAALYANENIERISYFPSLEDWSFIFFFRDSALQTDISSYETGKENSMLPENEYAKMILQRIESENRPDWLYYANNGMPIPKGSSALTLAHGLAIIDYAVYLHTRIQEIEQGNITVGTKVQEDRIYWIGNAIELFTLFADLKENDLIKGSNAEIARVICTAFRDKDGKVFDFLNVQNKLNSKQKSRKRIDFSSWN